MSKKIIGFTGSLGSGCTTSAKHLQQAKGYDYLSISSDVLQSLAKKHNKPFNTGEDKQDFGNFVRGSLREEYRAQFLDFIERSSNNVVIECFRNPVEIDFLREEFPHFYLIALYSPKDLREKRKAIQDFRKLDARDEGEDDKLGQQVRKCVNNADIVIDNSFGWRTMTDADDFFEKLNQYLQLLENPYRNPSEKEMIMHLAYSVSLLSTCIQRQVGAVITDENYKVLSTGYNDVPRDSDSCFDLHSECYRKIKKRTHLLELFPDMQFCPICGNKLTLQGDLLDSVSIDPIVCKLCNRKISNLFPVSKELDYCRSLHAEENAILSNPYTAEYFSSKNKTMLIFTTTFPCMLCAKKIANSGISHIVFVEPYPVEEAQEILQENGVTVEAFEGIKSLKFNWIFRKRGKYIKDFASTRRKELNSLLKGGN